jgi:hypothetical protein
MGAKSLTVAQVVDRISECLGSCSQKVIASLIAVSETALSQARKRAVDDPTDRKVGSRLMNLLYVVETLTKDETLNADAILKVLVTPCSPQENGSYLDVASAIQLGTVSNTQLLDIADAALKHLRSRYEADKRPADDALYNQAHAS